MFAMAPGTRSRWTNGADAFKSFRDEVDQFCGLLEANNAPAVVSLPVSIWKEGEDVVVEVDVPGVAEADLDVTYHKGRLVLRGERKAPEGAKFVHNARRFGKFEQTIALSEDYSGESVQASFSQGVFRAKFAPRPESQPRKVTFSN